MSDVAYGFQSDQKQTCAKFQHLTESRPQPIEQCYAKEVKENKLSRSTVSRLVLKASKSQPNAYGIKRAEITSQYVFKNLKAEDSAMHAVSVAEMDLRQLRQVDQSALSEQSLQDYGKDEKLLFSNQQVNNEKRFYMFGDDEFSSHTSPFKDTKGKVTLVKQSLRQLAQTTANPNPNIGIEASAFLIKLLIILNKSRVNIKYFQLI